MPNIYDYINEPHKSVINGYQPCYLTRVSAVICRATGSKFKIPRDCLGFGMNEPLSENLLSLLILFIWVFILITLPINCWAVALTLPKGGK